MTRTTRAKFENARISLKHSVIVCKELKNKKLERAEKILENLIDKRVSLNGKYYTNTAKKILEILRNAETNARFKGFDLEKTFVKNIKVDKGFTFIRPKSRWRFRGRRAKSTNLEIIVEER